MSNQVKPKVWTAKEVERILMLAEDVISLDTPVGDPDGGIDTTLGDFIESEEPTPEEEVLQVLRHDTLIEYMNKYLNKAQCHVLCMRYGMDDGIYHTLEEIGHDMGITRERVRQIEAKGLRKLKCQFAAHGLSMEDF